MNSSTKDLLEKKVKERFLRWCLQRSDYNDWSWNLNQVREREKMSNGQGKGGLVV